MFHLLMHSLTVEMQNTGFYLSFRQGKMNQSKPNLIAISATFDKGPDFVCVFSSGSLLLTL